MGNDELTGYTIPLGSQEHYKYVVVCSNYQGKWLFSRHKERTTWETQGGHVEEGESYGMVFLAVVHELGALPESEMQETRLFEELPENLTYPKMTPLLVKEAETFLNNL